MTNSTDRLRECMTRGRGSKNERNLRDVIYGWPLTTPSKQGTEKYPEVVKSIFIMFSNHTIITKRKKSQLVAIARKEVKNSMQYNIKVNLIYFKVRVKALNTMPFSGKASFCFDSESSVQEVWGLGF